MVKFYKKISTIIMLLVVVLFVCKAGADVVDRIVAVVDGEAITMSDLEQVVDMASKQGRPILENKLDAARREALDSFIDEIILRHEIKKAELEVTDEELTRAIAGVLVQNRITLGQLQADLARKGVNYATYKEQISEQIKTIKFINQVIGSQLKLTDADLRDYYDRNRSMFGGADSTFENVKEKVYDALYEERSQEALKNYLYRQRQKVYVDIRL